MAAFYHFNIGYQWIFSLFSLCKSFENSVPVDFITHHLEKTVPVHLIWTIKQTDISWESEWCYKNR